MISFSIITPVLNQASTIEACIRSVADQGVDVQHIIIDGGSTDGTIELIKKNEDKLSFWISEKDSGQSEAINKGLKHATGTWFNWLNADDQLAENALQTVLKKADDNTKVVVGKCAHANIQGDVVDVGSARIWSSLEATLGNYSMGQPSVFYRTEIVRQLGGLNQDLHLCLDMDLWFRFLLEYGQDDIQTTDEVLSRFLVHEGAKSSTHKLEMRAEKYGIFRALLNNADLPEVLQEFFEPFPVPKNVRYRHTTLNWNELQSHFSWHLLLNAYETRNKQLTDAYFRVVRKGSVLSSIERLKWQARLATLKMLKR